MRRTTTHASAGVEGGPRPEPGAPAGSNATATDQAFGWLPLSTIHQKLCSPLAAFSGRRKAETDKRTVRERREGEREKAEARTGAVAGEVRRGHAHGSEAWAQTIARRSAATTLRLGPRVLRVCLIVLETLASVEWQLQQGELLWSGGGGSGIAAMDAQQQQMDLVMRHQSMPTVCESEDALGSSESDPGRPARPRGKRSRAAEVHNLSEKRRRSRINEKMKALQTLIPNSSKTDKASMLDDAIEYLKQLQLQVQMLSMRNGLYLPPGNLSGAPETLAPSEMCAALNQSGSKASNSGVVVLPGNQIPVARLLFDPPNHDQRHENPLVLQSIPSSSTAVEPQFLREPVQPNLQSFQLALPPEMIFKEDMMLEHRLTSAQKTTSLPGHEAKPGRLEAHMVNSDLFDRGSLGKERAQDLMPKNTQSLLFMPYLHSLQSSDAQGSLRAGSN